MKDGRKHPPQRLANCASGTRLPSWSWRGRCPVLYCRSYDIAHGRSRIAITLSILRWSWKAVRRSISNERHVPIHTRIEDLDGRYSPETHPGWPSWFRERPLIWRGRDRHKLSYHEWRVRNSSTRRRLRRKIGWLLPCPSDGLAAEWETCLEQRNM